MPSLLGYVEKTGELPAHLTFSLASLMSLYRGGKLTGDGRLECQRDGQPYYLQDDAAVLNFFADTSSESPEEQAKEFLSNEAFLALSCAKCRVWWSPSALPCAKSSTRGCARS